MLCCALLAMLQRAHTWCWIVVPSGPGEEVCFHFSSLLGTPLLDDSCTTPSLACPAAVLLCQHQRQLQGFTFATIGKPTFSGPVPGSRINHAKRHKLSIPRRTDLPTVACVRNSPILPSFSSGPGFGALARSRRTATLILPERGQRSRAAAAAAALAVAALAVATQTTISKLNGGGANSCSPSKVIGLWSMECARARATYDRSVELSVVVWCLNRSLN
uniref:Putative secreted protein n=1 Tax=Anopheles darlingi TaxID=43151 RepID=A0A2M4D5R7_ANODA